MMSRAETEAVCAYAASGAITSSRAPYVPVSHDGRSCRAYVYGSAVAARYAPKTSGIPNTIRQAHSAFIG